MDTNCYTHTTDDWANGGTKSLKRQVLNVGKMDSYKRELKNISAIKCRFQSKN